MPTKQVIQYIFTEPDKDKQNYWLIARPGSSVDSCSKDLEFNVDLFINAELKALTSIWLDLPALKKAIEEEKIVLIGEPQLASSIDQWMVRSSFAD